MKDYLDITRKILRFIPFVSMYNLFVLIILCLKKYRIKNVVTLTLKIFASTFAFAAVSVIVIHLLPPDIMITIMPIVIAFGFGFISTTFLLNALDIPEESNATSENENSDDQTMKN